jgi:hypothetical protein
VTTYFRRRASVFLSLSSLDSVVPLVPSFSRNNAQPFCDAIFCGILQTTAALWSRNVDLIALRVSDLNVGQA